MEQFHYDPVALDEPTKTTAYWAMKPNRRLVVFVHGFGGKALGTWVEFPQLLESSPKARHCDFVYYGYDGVRTRAFVSALKLLAFLKQVAGDPVRFINGTLHPGAAPRAAGFDFDSIIVVAHSLGAIVSRQALVSAHKAGEPWAGKVQLVFFAPAHSGADVLALVGETLTGIPFLKGGAKSYAQVLLDLEPESALLVKLRTEVQKQLPTAPYLAAKMVVLAEHDRIVDPSPFIPEDPDPPRLVLGRGHSDVCKPNTAFLDPLDTIEALL